MMSSNHSPASHRSGASPRTPVTQSRSSSGAHRNSPAAHGFGASPQTPSIHSRSNSSSHGNSPGAAPQNGSATPVSQNNINNAMQALTVQPGAAASTLAKRPGFGQKGHKVHALTNCFRLDTSRMMDIDVYSCDVKSVDQSPHDITGRMRRQVLFLLLQQHQEFGHAATDYGQKIFSPSKYRLCSGPLTPQAYTVNYYDEAQAQLNPPPIQTTCEVTVQYRSTLQIGRLRQYLSDMSSNFGRLEEYNAALNIMLSRWPNQQANMVTAARGAKFFCTDPQNERQQLTGGLEVYPGYFRSARTSQVGLIANVNTVAGAFFEEVRMDQLLQAWPGRHQNQSLTDQCEMYTSMFKGIRVKVSYDGVRAKSVNGVAGPVHGNTSPSGDNVRRNLTVQSNTGQNKIQSVTVNQYFTRMHPNIERPNRGSWVLRLSEGRGEVLVPADLCHILPGQAYRHLITDAVQTTKMINFACRRPATNKDMILNTGLSLLGVGTPGGPQDLFQLTLDGNMIKVIGRGLPGPVPDYKTGKVPAAASGSWNMANKKFKEAPPQQKVLCKVVDICTDGQSPVTNLTYFTDMMHKGIKQYCGDETAKHKLPQAIKPDPDDLDGGIRSLRTWFRGLFNKLSKEGVKVVFVVLPNASASTYAALKYVADCEVGIHTICSVRKGNQVKASIGEIANLMLKLNMKLGGLNHTIPPNTDILTPRTMIVGLDVSHAGERSMENAPSIAGIVATTGKDFFRYAGAVQRQRHLNDKKQSIEMIVNLKKMMQDRLKLYEERNKGLPDRVIVYRDGVSDGQFDMVLAEEIPSVKSAFKEVYGNTALPKLTFIVVQKRHHVRFYRDSSHGPGFDAKGNLLPGFVLDGQITSERTWDWYNTSHVCLQGTSRPAKYIVLYDENNSNPDALQTMTHQHCWLFGRATKSISVHPAARYADMLCDRARCYMWEALHDGKDTMYSALNDPWNGGLAPQLRDTMFFV